jgi:hypothetical protein
MRSLSFLFCLLLSFVPALGQPTLKNFNRRAFSIDQTAAPTNVVKLNLQPPGNPDGPGDIWSFMSTNLFTQWTNTGSVLRPTDTQYKFYIAPGVISSTDHSQLGTSTEYLSGVFTENLLWARSGFPGGNVFDSFGPGSPEGVVVASPGSIWRDTTGGGIYHKATGLGDTGWEELGAGLWESVAGNLQPIDPLYRYTLGTNATFSMRGTNNTSSVSLTVQNNATALLTPQDVIELGAGVNAVTLDTTSFVGTGGFAPFAIDLGTKVTPWNNVWLQATNHIIGFYPGGVTNYAGLDISQTGTNGYALFLSLGDGIAGQPRPFRFDTDNPILTGNLAEFANDGTNQFTIAAITDIGAADGSKLFANDGKFHTFTGGTFNPTTGFLPYNAGGSWGDSPWVRYATNQIGFDDNTANLFWLQRWGGLSGSESWGIGEEALGHGGSLIGEGNIAIGKRALLGIRAGTENFAAGANSLQSLTTGNRNVVLGQSAGNALTTEDRNTILGAYAWNARHGSNNISIGYNSNDSLTDTVTNTITIGTLVGAHTARATNSGDILLGNDLNTRLIVPIASWGSGDGTLVYRNDGTFGSVPGGVGDTIWTNNAGYVQFPSSSVLSISTNDGSIFNGQSSIFAWQNNLASGVFLWGDGSLGENDRYIEYGAGGTNTASYNPGDRSAYTILHTSTSGINEANFVAVGTNGMDMKIVIDIDRSAGGDNDTAQFRGQAEGFNLWNFDPTKPADTGAAYTFDTWRPKSLTEVVHAFNNNGTNLLSVYGSGKSEALGGFSSLAADAAVAISATGWTNSFGKDARVWMDGTNLTYTVYSASGSPYYTNAVAIGHDTFKLITGEKFIVTSGAAIGVAKP